MDDYSMPENTETVAHQPAPSEQNGGENSAANQDAGSFARMLAQKEKARVQAPAPTAEDRPNESAPPATEEAEKPEAVQPEPEGQPEGEGEDGKVLSPETKSLDPETQKKVNQRIGKEVAKTKREAVARAKAEAERDALKAQLEAAQKGSQPATPQQPQTLAQIEDLESLERHQQEAKLTIRWVDEQLDRDDFPAEGLKTEHGVLTKSDLKKIRMNARVALEDHIPERRRFLEVRDSSRRQAAEVFPWLEDPEAPEYSEAQAAIKANPWLNNLPNREYIIGVQLLGLQKLKEIAEAKKKPAAKPNTPKPSNGHAAVASVGGPTRTSFTAEGSAQVAAMSERLKAKGGATHQDYAALLKARELQRHSS